MKGARRKICYGKITSEKNGYITKTLDYGNMCVDQHKETLEAMMGCV
jgi:hypothetical protein